jgi:hypothetical protein
LAFAEEDMSSDAERPTGGVTGPASYFPSIEKAYGRSIAEWKAIVRAHPDLRHGELVNPLKTEHGMGHGHANALVAHTLHESPKR